MGSTGPGPAHVRGLVTTTAALLALAGTVTACGSGNGEGGDAGKAASVDNGTKLTMWTRAATRPQSEALVKAYNATHKNQVELTVIPTDDYQAKVGAAAGSRDLPDLFASDVVFVPNYTSSGLFADITGRIIDIIDAGVLGRERKLEIRETPEFLKIAHRVREGLRAGHSYDD